MIHAVRLLLLLVTLSSGLSAASISWSGAIDQNWSKPGNWTGGVLPGAGDTAVFASQAVTIDTSAATAGAITGSALITIPSGGTLTVPGTIAAGTITLSGGTLSGATVQATLVATTSTSTLTNITVPAGALLDLATNAGAVCNISGLTVNGQVMIGNAAGTTYGSMTFIGSQTINGSGDILFGTDAVNISSISLSGSSAILTIAAGMTVHGKNAQINLFSANQTLVNNGTLGPDVAGGTFTINTTNWTNNALFSVIGGSTLSISASGTGLNAASTGSIALGSGSVLNMQGTQIWTNPGSITGSGTTFNLGGNFTSATGLTIDGTGNAININGTVNNTAGLVLTTFPWHLVGGTISGGSVTDTAPNTLIITGSTGTLTNVTIPLGSVLDLATVAGAVCNVSGLTVNGQVMIGNAAGTTYGSMTFIGSQTINGSGDILFGTDAVNISSISLSGSSAILTIAAGMTVHGKNAQINLFSANQTLVNNGTLGPDVAGGTFTINTTNWTNNALFSVIGGSTLSISASGTGLNAASTGSIALGSGSVLNMQGTQIWTNPGSITGSGTTFNLGGNFTSATGLTIDGTGNAININGTVNNTAGLVLTTFPWHLVGGTISGGSVTDTAPNTLIITGSTGTLTNVTIPLGSVLDLATVAGAVCNVSGLTVNGQVMIGNAAGTTYGSMTFIGSQTINGSGDILFGTDAVNISSISLSGSSAILTIAAGMTVHGKNAQINLFSANQTLVNNGTLGPDVAGGTFTINTTNWTNNALFSVIGGSTLSISASGTGLNAASTGSIALGSGSVLNMQGTQIWTNPGSITGSGTTFNLGGNFTSATGLTIDGTGNAININGTVNNTAGLVLTTFPWHLVGGTISGGSVTDTAPNTLIITGSTGTLTNVTIPLGSVLDLATVAGAVCNVSGLTVNGQVMIGNAAGTTYGSMTFIGSQTINGSGDILFGTDAVNISSISLSGSSAILTIAAGMTVHGKNAQINLFSANQTLVNNGTLGPDVAGGTFTINTTNWTNNALFSVIGGSTLSISASGTGLNAASTGSIALGSGSVLNMQGTQIWTNPGSITGSGTTFNLGGNFTSATGLTIDGTGNAININGTVNNTAGLVLTTFPWHLVGGTISGGSVTDTAPNTLIITGSTGTLTNVTIPLGSVLDLATVAGAVCNVSGLTVNGQVMIGNAAGTTYGSMTFIGSQTINGSGDILFGTDAVNISSISLSGSSAILTIAAGMTVHGKNAQINLFSANQTLVNNGTLGPDVAGGTFTINTTNWTNNALFSVIGGSTLSISASGTGLNAASTGSIALGSGSVLNMQGTQIWTNPGSITGSGTTFNLGGNFTSATGLTIDGTGNAININGTVNNTAGLVLTTFPWHLVGGTISGGSVTDTAPNTLIITGSTGTLTNVTIPLGSVLDLATVAGAVCNVSGLTVNGQVMIGNAAGTTYGSMTFIGSQTINGSGDILFGTDAVNISSISLSGSSAILTIAAGMTVHGKNAQINLFSANQSLVNNGTISNDVPGGAFTISSTTITNNGTISISHGAAETWNVTAAFTQSASGILDMEIGGLGSYDKLIINGTAHLGGTLNLALINGYFLHQNDAFTLITTNASGLSGNFTAVTGSFSLAYNTASLVATAQDTTVPTVSVTPALAFSPGSPLAFTITFSEPVSGLTSGGLTVTNGTVSNISGSGTTYGATITPSALGGSTNEVVGVTVNANAASNSGSVFNAAASNIATTTYEIAPTVQVSPVNGAVVGSPPTFTITFSNPVHGLIASGLTITGATINTITPPSPATNTTSYTVTTTMGGPGAVQFNVNAGVVVDQAGNTNPATAPETVTYATAISWIGGNGTWSTAANWSGGAVPGAASDVVIPTGVTVTLSTATANLHTLDLVGNLIIAGSGTLQVATQLTANDNIITLDGGTLTLQGGQLQGAIVQLGSGGSFLATPSSGTLNGVAIAAGTTFDMSPSNASCLVTGGLVVDGTVLIGDAAGTHFSQLFYSGTQTWSGSGNIIFGANGNNSLSNSGVASLTIQAPLGIHGIAVILNATSAGSVLTTQGPLTADTAASVITINADTWANSGLITMAAGSTFNIIGSTSWTSTGGFAASGAIFNLGGHFLPVDAITFPGVGNTVNITGALNNTGGATLTSPWFLHNGTITGGTIAFSGAGALIATPSSGTLAGVHLAASATFDMSQSNASCLVTGGLVVDGTVLIGDAAGTHFSQLFYSGTQTWSGSGNIIFGANGNNSLSNSGVASLTIQAPLGIHGIAVILNATSAGSVLTTQGPLTADTAASVITINADTWANSGLITMAAGSTFNIIGSTSWTSTGGFAASGAIFNLGGHFLPVDAITFPGVGNTVNITGALNNTGGATLTSPWFLHNGTITGGTIAFSGAGALIATPSSGTLAGVHLAASATFDMSQSNASCLVTGGLVVDGTVLIGDAAGTHFSQLFYSGTQTWSGSGNIIFGANGNNSLSNSGVASLTIQAPLGIHGIAVILNATSAGSVLTTQGPLTADTAASVITINADTWANSGLITMAAGSTFNIIGSTSWTSTGGFAASGAIFNLGGHFLPVDAITFPGVGNTVNITGALNNTGGATLTSPWFLHNGTITGGTIAFSGAGALIATPSSGTLAGVHLAASATFDMSQSNASCLVTGGLVVDGTVLIGDAAGTHFSQLFYSGTQTWSGSGNIIFGANGNNSLSNSGVASLTIQAPLGIHGIAVILNATSAGSVLTTQGPLTADTAASVITINADTWANSGLITMAAGSTFNIIGSTSWTSTGGFAASGAIFNLGGHFLPVDAITFPGVGNTVNITGALNNTGGATLTSPWFLHNGTITGGTIAFSGAGALIATPSSGTLAGVHLAASATFDMSQSNASCLVTGGLVVDGTVLIGDAAGTHFSQLFYSGTQVWSGSGQITFGGNGNNALSNSGASSLTIQAPLTIHGKNGTVTSSTAGSNLINGGTIASDVAGGALHLNAPTVTNQGTLTVDQGATASLSITGAFVQTSSGVLALELAGTSSHDTLAITGSATLDGTITLTPISGYQPNQPDAIPVITTTGTHSGTFATVNGPFTIDTSNATQVIADALNTTPPTVVVSTPAALTNAGPIPFTLTFSQPVTLIGAVQISNGTGIPSGSGTVYTLSVTPTAQGPVTVTLPIGAAQSAASVTNTAAGSATATFDSIPPTASITPNGTATNQPSIPFTVAFSEVVSAPVALGFVVTNGTIASISSGPAASYTVTVTASGPAVTLQLASHAVSDLAGNLSVVTPSATVTYDTTPPTVLSVLPTGTITSNPAISFLVTFSKPVNPLILADLTIANGAIGTISGSGTAYTVPVTAASEGPVTLTVISATDPAGNPLAGPLGATVTYDITPPTVASISPNGTITHFGPIPFVITFSEAVTPPVAGDLMLGNGTLQGITGSGSIYTATVLPSGPGPFSVTIAVISGSDLAGNPLSVTAAASAAVTYDTIAPTILSITPNGGALTNASPIDFTVTFSKPIASVVASTTNGTPQATSGGPTVITFPVIPSTNGTVTVSFPAGSFTDLAGNANTAAASASVTFSNIRPSVAVTPNLTATNQSPITFTLTFSSAVTGLTIGGLQVTNGTLGMLSGSGTTYTIPVTPVADGPVSLSVNAGAAFDLSSNPNLASAAATVTYDTVPPTVAVTPDGTITNQNPILFALTFSEPVVGLTAAGLSVTNGALGTLTGSGTDYLMPVIPSGAGPVTLQVSGQAAADAAGNTNLISNLASVTFDNVPPTVAVSAAVGSATNQSPIIYTLTFSKPVTGLTTAGLTVGNGTLGVLSGSGGAYAIPVTPIAPGAVTLQVAAAAASDAAGNPNAASNLLSVTYSTSNPTVAITPSGTTTNLGPITFTLTFSSTVTGLTTSGLTVGNGSLGALSGSGSTYTIPITPIADGAVTLQANAAAANDLAGNPSLASNTASVVYDTVAPTVAVAPTGTATNQSPITFTLTFSEPVAGLSAGGLMVANGTLGSISGGPAVYAVPVTPLATGPVTLMVSAGAAHDPAGNPSAASAIASVTYSTSGPTVTVAPTGSATNQAPITFTLTFSAPVAGLGAAGLVVGNGTLGAISGGPAVYTVPVTPLANGPVTLQVAAAAASDAASNPNAASPVASVVYDTVPPGIALAISSPLPLTAAATTLTITFSEPVSGFAAGSIAVSNATLSGFTALTASTYAATLSPSTPVTASIHVAIPAGAANDLAGNPALAAALILSQQTTVASTTLVTPVIATSPGGSTVYGALCPGTWNGLGQLQSFLSGKTDAQARGFVWDAQVQDFVQVPAQAPSGGWQPFQGVFLATRQPAAFDFNGSMSTLDYELVLKPGWNFVGLPPLDDNGVELVSHAWVDLRLEDTSGNLLSGAQRTGLIDIGPWLWDGASYAQVALMQSGIGYWIDNASSPGVDLVLRRLSSAEIAGTAPILDAAHGGAHGAGTAAAIGFHAHGTPPLPPGLGSGHHETATHGCGLGSGIGALLALSAVLLLRLRLRTQRRA